MEKVTFLNTSQALFYVIFTFYFQLVHVFFNDNYIQSDIKLPNHQN